MKFLILSFVLAFGSSAYANSNIAATWIDQEQILSIQIVDDPATPPFVAGEIWRAIRGTGANKLVKTKNFELKCAGANQANGTSFGTCKIRVARNNVILQPAEINFAISRSEAQSVLTEFEQPLAKDNILIKSGATTAAGNDLFLFEVNWRYEMIASVINRTLFIE